ncbi:hypothetical protein PPACK8108_LOCUS22568 [Phakopsora pachyrhizi]|uniref:Mitochondrial distribution and morphology protein 34 n=1 Tax=Phakopsora pachyrhizi TaxID=170000 RepID=A0AAV0BM85_PHAPC|nr:hypothetical protein PPACK8108_LOCUS22568 [Phakopsora pachyrhizi]
MSFEFKWPDFSDSFYDHAKSLLCNALNKGEKPPIIADRIQVEQLDMGTIPPELEILEIGDLGTDRFRGIFRMIYAGDASICLQTKVQANPLRQKSSTTTPDIITTPSILFATSPLIVPMTLRLSTLKLRAILVLVISRLEGVTLVFKNDPLESVQVSSTFDSIERQLRELFRNELPGIIHQLSRTWLKPSSHSNSRILQSQPPSPSPSPTITSTTSHSPNLSFPIPINSNNTLFSAGVPDEVESYDPTYGLRPSHPPLTGCFSNYRSLVERRSRSLGLGVILSSLDDDGARGELVENSVQLSEEHASGIAQDLNSRVSSSSASASKQNFTTMTNSRDERRMAKPRIFHSNSAGLIGPQSTSSPVSSLFGQDDCPSVWQPASSRRSRPSHRDVEDLSREEVERRRDDDGEGELLRNRRMERFSTHEKTLSSSSLPTLNRSQNSHLSSAGLCNSPRPATQTPYSSFSILPSTTQRSSLSSFNPQYEYPQTDLLRNQLPSSPIFLSSHSASSDQRSEINLQEDITDIKEDSTQCALLASLVRGNWTLSPYSQSISHYASRSTPLSPERKTSTKRRDTFWIRTVVAVVGTLKDQLEGFKQKRIIRIGKISK